MSDFADAINAAMREQIAQLEDYGGFLAQAGIPLSEAQPNDQHVEAGYHRQLQDFPNG